VLRWRNLITSCLIFFRTLFLRKKTNRLSSFLISPILTYSIHPSVCLFLSLKHRCTFIHWFWLYSCLAFFFAICLCTSLFLSQFHCQSLSSSYINSTICLSVSLCLLALSFCPVPNWTQCFRADGHPSAPVYRTRLPSSKLRIAQHCNCFKSSWMLFA